jgi:hypothetical protein
MPGFRRYLEVSLHGALRAIQAAAGHSENCWWVTAMDSMGRMRLIKRKLLLSGVRPSHRLDYLNSFLHLAQWLREHPAPRHFDDRNALYDHVFSLANGAPFDFLEFGVFRGASILYWSGLTDNPQVRFFGFDTFTGLPETWHTGMQTLAEGSFSAQGQLPETKDPRVRFVRGKFQDTLPGFLCAHRLQDKLIVHCDADLFTSTLYTLTRLDTAMKAGTILVFDDFAVANHDFQAFVDYTSSYGRDYEVVAHAELDFAKIAIRLL